MGAKPSSNKMIAPHVRFKAWFWIKLTGLLLFLENKGWKKPRQMIRTPLMVLVLGGGEQEKPMFSPGLRLKVKLWLLAIRFSTWLQRAIEIRAAKSAGLIGGGAMLVHLDGEILNKYLKTLEESTPFGVN